QLLEFAVLVRRKRCPQNLGDSHARLLAVVAIARGSGWTAGRLHGGELRLEAFTDFLQIFLLETEFGPEAIDESSAAVVQCRSRKGSGTGRLREKCCCRPG